MIDVPEYNYWRWQPGENHFDWDLDGRIDRDELDENDLRSNSYNVGDLASRNRFWTAHQAAAIYFGRDPEKVRLYQEGFDGDPTDESAELRHQIDRLKSIIEDHQALRNLPALAIDRERFFEWAAACGLDCNHLQQWLQYDRSPPLDRTAASMAPLPQPAEKRDSDVVRVNNTLYRMILGLVHGRGERPLAIAERVTQTLEKLSSEHGDTELLTGKRQFQRHIEIALDLLK